MTGHDAPAPSTADLPERVRLVVLFGGQSAEHEVSCTSAASVLAAADPDRYDLQPVGITPDGRWVLAEDAIAALAAGASGLPSALTAAGPELDPLPTVAARRGPGGGNDVPTVVLPLLHGPLGEDGTIQGMLELAGVPYVGSGVLGSALCMDKAKAKEVLAHHGVAQPRWIARRDTGIEADLVDRVTAELGWPVFVKPANLGSSVGISKVADPYGLAAAVEEALRFDEWVVIEEAIVGREIECAVLGGADPIASVPGEILPSAEFYDYDDKYSGDGADLAVPADLPDDVTAEVQRLALTTFAALRADGFARVDLFYEEAGRGLLVNEVNTIPGFTPHSMYPRLWAASGLPYDLLIDRLVALALERRAHRAAKVGRPRD
ncbi:MAG TPA: D-alanine--D-alanine ligase family protein [Acidimicrobiales bacterium]|nr:D-alanine--D-alanine ligase family protein [Acidimicrobiales bacterium]